MRVTRRGLFATIAAAIVGKPADKGLPLAFVRSFDLGMVSAATVAKCQCPGCQYARGVLSRPTYEFYPVAFTAKIGDTITVKKPARPLLNPEA